VNVALQEEMTDGDFPPEATTKRLLSRGSSSPLLRRRLTPVPGKTLLPQVDFTAILAQTKPIRQIDWIGYETKVGAYFVEIRPLSEHQNYNLESVHIKTATLIKFAREIVY